MKLSYEMYRIYQILDDDESFRKLCLLFIHKKNKNVYFRGASRHEEIIRVIGEEKYGEIKKEFEGAVIYIQSSGVIRIEYKRIREDYNEGMTVKKLCEKYRRTPDSIRKILHLNEVFFQNVNRRFGIYRKEYPVGSILERDSRRYLTAASGTEKRCDSCEMPREFCPSVKCRSSDRTDGKNTYYKRIRE